MTQRIHIGLETQDLERSIEFYEKLFDVEASKRRSDYANFRLNEPPIHLALVAGRDTSPRQSHLGVELPDQETLHSWQARVKEAGLPHRLEDKAVCCYAKADKVWLDDPDGNAWELWVRTGEADVLSEPGSTCCA